MRGARPLLHMLLLFALVGMPLSVSAQETTVDPVAELLARMSPEARVGQLAVVTFPGMDVGALSDIGELIRDYGVGGVMLSPSNGNFVLAGMSAAEVLSMTTQLQRAAWSSAETPAAGLIADPDAPSPPPYVPLLLLADSAFGGLETPSLISEITRLPTELALGATWDRGLAEQIGAVLGQELAALGLNLYLGPSLDVSYTPRPGDPADLGTSVFGGDPFWVGELGRAFVSGLHTGGAGRVLVAPRYFPGLGSADRPLENEVPTVSKPLEQLRQVELAPFFAVANGEPGQADVADAFLVTHIRYRGFQGNNIRRTTRPISLDANALLTVVALPELSTWRQAGGVLIADNLGMQSVHRSYDPSGATFNGRRVSLDALRAGNDLLILDRFSATGDWEEHFGNVRDTLQFLASQYREDPAVQAIVDASVYRILQLKFRLYPEFSIDAVVASGGSLGEVAARAHSLHAQIAAKALTLVSPPSADLLPAPPQAGDLITIFSQSLPTDAATEALLRLYGPDATGVVRADRIRSFTFAELYAALEDDRQSAADGGSVVAGEGDGSSASVLQALTEARWIVFLATGLDPTLPESGALKAFLSQKANLIEAHIAVLSFGPPYELDSTEISKVDVFYALYDPGMVFVEAGLRALFRDLPAVGASPVDIPALNYLLPERLMPDSAQVLALDIVDSAGTVLTQTMLLDIQIGDLIHLKTAAITDRNGNPVPDGTPVSFVLRYPSEGIEKALVGETLDGVAGVAVTLDRVGQLDITAYSEPAL